MLERASWDERKLMLVIQAFFCSYTPPSGVSCSVLPQVSYAQSTGLGNAYQDERTYTCNIGYYIQGQSKTVTQRKLTCGNDGNWDVTVPTCVCKWAIPLILTFSSVPPFNLFLHSKLASFFSFLSKLAMIVN